MKGRVIVLQHHPSRAALVVDGRVEDLLVDDGNLTRPPQPGEIWAAQMTRTTQGAAFVDLGGGQTGFLRDTKGLKGVRTFAVQITGCPEPGKAIPVDRRLLLKGRGVILTPQAPGLNVSRKIKSPDERERLSSAMPDLPDGVGAIIRSAASGLPEEVVAAEARQLIQALSALSPDTLASDPPSRPGTSPLAQHWSPETHALREWSLPLPDMIAAPSDLADRLAWTDHLHVFFEDPDLQDRLTPGDGDPFDHFGVWDEIERLRSPAADLVSGGWMAIEATRAMVTIDVNTGDGFGTGDAMTANIEAARELPRQLRLRGLGGQIIIDFAPMKKMPKTVSL